MIVQILHDVPKPMIQSGILIPFVGHEISESFHGGTSKHVC